MHFLQAVSLTFSVLLINVGVREGLVTQGNSNLTATNHGSTGHGHNVDITEMTQMLLNHTAELENLKQQTVEIESLRELTSNLTQQTENQTVEIESLRELTSNLTQQTENRTAEIESLRELTINLTQQTENDRSTIQLLQNTVFSLETELESLNASKPTFSSDNELSSYLHGMNHLIKEMVTKEANNKNLTHLLNVTVENFKDQNVQVQHTSLSLIDIHITPEMNGSLNRQLEERINGYIHDQIANLSKKVAFTASVSSSSSSWSTSTLVFPVVITNLGRGYNPNDGVFTAPTAGIYVFFVNVQSYNSLSVYVDIVVNGARKVRTMASNHYDAGPNLAVLTLLRQDRVWVKRYSGQGYYSNGPMTTFSGFLIG